MSGGGADDGEVPVHSAFDDTRREEPEVLRVSRHTTGCGGDCGTDDRAIRTDAQVRSRRSPCGNREGELTVAKYQPSEFAEFERLMCEMLNAVIIREEVVEPQS
jgi:hypothetical protein